MTELTAIVMAAGQGKRMKSPLSKVLHRVAGRPLVHYPVRAALDAGAARVVCVVSTDNHEAVLAALRPSFGDRVVAVIQDPPRGTGDAVRVGLAEAHGDRALVLCGDTPLLEPALLSRLHHELDSDGVDLVITSALLDDPTGYGRVLRDDGGGVREIREHRDLRTDEERACREINAGVYAAKMPFLRAAVQGLRADNAQGEYYFTDVAAVAATNGRAVAVVGDAASLLGVNDRAQLTQAEAVLYRRIAERHGRAGASVKPGARVDDTVCVEPDATVEAGAVLRGQTTVAAGARIDVGAVITDSEIGSGARILPYSVITESRVGTGAQIGPFAHLRPGSEIEEDAHIGNFVETKKTRVRRGAKANHLAYLGDGDVGEGANVGAGTIFCNYDGFQKHRTVIGAGAFIGSDSQLVAPITIGDGAYVATGTTVTRDVPADGLAIARVRQENKDGYAPRLRARLRAAKKG